MTKEPFNVYIDRLKDDDTEKIFEVVSPEFLKIEEKELSFIETVTVTGKAYLAKNHLILDLKIKAKATMPCSICNESTSVAIHCDDFTHTEEICEIPSSIYDFSEEVRNAILLKTPHFIECHEGHCPNRKNLHKYRSLQTEETHTPFSNLSIHTDSKK